MKKDETKDLDSGNVISLLPESLCYEVICEGSLGKNGVEKEQEKTSKSMETDTVLPVTDKTVAPDQEKPLASSKVPTGRREREMMFSLIFIGQYN